MSEEAVEKSPAEIKKITNDDSMSAEATVVRNYIDWILDMPCREKTENKFTLKESDTILKKIIMD